MNSLKKLLLVAASGLSLLSPALVRADVLVIGGMNMRKFGAGGDQFGAEAAAGVNAYYETNFAASQERKSGVDMGIGFGHVLSPKASWWSEFHFVRRGTTWRLVDPALSGHVDQALSLDAIEMPVLLRLKTARTDGLSPHFIVGMGLGHVTSASLALETDQGPVDEQNVDNDIQSTYLDVQFGAGLMSRSFLIEAKYVSGISNLAASGGASLKPSDLTVQMGIIF